MAVTGMDDLLRNLGDVTRRYKDAIAAAIYQEAVKIGNKAIKQTPVDTGHLRQSFYLSPPTNIDKPVCKIGFGSDYSLYVHERTDIPHKVGKAKFLEDPINEAKAGWESRIARRTKANYDAGIGLASSVAGVAELQAEKARKAANRKQQMAANAAQRKKDSAARRADRAYDRRIKSREDKE